MTTEKKFNKRHNQGVRKEQTSNSHDGVPSKNGRNFHIVGIGASAGGLEALEQFFKNMPPDSGMAFVIVQHLDPTRKSSMPEILSRFTMMPVYLAAEGMKVEADSIYLIPPDRYMGIKKGSLYLEEVADARGMRLPVDFFLRSLAKEKGADAIGIILSGTGSDGTLGLKAIKAESGTVFVQTPESAKYDGMPRSAINTGLVEYVLPPEQMPQKLIDFVKNYSVNQSQIAINSEKIQEPLQQIFAILRARTGHDFSHYKQGTIKRRLQRRMSVRSLSNIADYADLLQGSEEEVKALLKDILISVTSFFRDPEAFEALKVQVKNLVNYKSPDNDLRIWVAGCATGEEAYSIAIVVSECLNEMEKNIPVQMYATDIDENALNSARAGIYPVNIAADITPERLKRFFLKEDKGYRVKKEIREMIVFAPQDFIKDPPFSKMDVICCRNLLIYLESEPQKKIIPLLHYALKPGGLLFLGTSETIGDATDLFTIVDKKWKVYRRREAVVSPDRLRFPVTFTTASREPADQLANLNETRLAELTEKIFMDNYAPTFAVVDEKYRLVYIRGKTDAYLEIPSGHTRWSILDMARKGLRTELASSLYRAVAEKKAIVQEGIHLKLNGGFKTINLKIVPLAEHGLPSGLIMVVFQEAGEITEENKKRAETSGAKHTARVEEELRLTKETLQSTIEELEATNEEVKSANEELLSNNEELQSTNEELDTSREELQSLNEELLTVNSELTSKTEMLTKANDDLKNYLNRTDIAIIFLDEDLKIRSFTPASTEVFNIRDIDIGRPLDEITSLLSYEGVADDTRDVLRTLGPKEIEVQRKDGHWYNMRILPYLTTQNVLAGLVVSFLDINKQKQSEADVIKTNQALVRQAQELKAANKELEGYSLTISNNLQPPLRHMEGFSKVLLEDYSDKLDENGKAYFQRITEASKLMSEFLNKLLELASVAMNDLNYEEVNLSEIVQNNVNKFQTSFPERKIEFVIQPGVMASGDARLLQVVLDNLMDNAIKFSSNVPKPRIEFGVTVLKDRETYFIKDNGVGFDMDYATKLFAPFVKLHMDGEFQGPVLVSRWSSVLSGAMEERFGQKAGWGKAPRFTLP